MKNIYLLEQSSNTGWDTYDSMVVIADNLDEAILLSYEHTGMLLTLNEVNYGYTNPIMLDNEFKGYVAVSKGCRGWAFEKHISSELIGKSTSEVSYVVYSSFNAG